MPINKTEDIVSWIKELNAKIYVNINKINLSESDFWFYDESTGAIRSKNNSFFTIKGLRKCSADGQVIEQPVIIQDEIGYLGIICKKFNGEMHYLMQAKIEPGNINKIQISPTIQATKSNFTQKHGGRKPAYLDYFINAKNYKIIVDQIQSEQSSRFLKKRNRNIIICVEDDVEVLSSHCWMTLEQIKYLMTLDNIVNMDTRTVLSCIPYSHMAEMGQIKDTALVIPSTERKAELLSEVYAYINDYKMFCDEKSELVPLYSLTNWEMRENEFVCKSAYSFKVVFCDIEIEGREVKHWTQPLFESTGIATFGLITCVTGGVRKFLVKAKPEIGCFDGIELGPTVQREYVNDKQNNSIDDFFDDCLVRDKGIVFDTLLSEEGGRFFCEQNRNVVIETEYIASVPDGYFWVDYCTLNELIQINNCVNIQLRNLLSVIRW